EAMLRRRGQDRRAARPLASEAAAGADPTPTAYREPAMTDTSSDLQTLIDQYLHRGDAVGWFEELYARANGDPRAVPWAHTSPRKELIEWVREKQPDGTGQAALVIGCGLGDDAEFLAGLNYQVTAFDVSKTAIEWCRHRFPHSTVKYQVADMFEPPTDW